MMAGSDILACGYKYSKSLSYYAATELWANRKKDEEMYCCTGTTMMAHLKMYRKKAGLNKVTYAMGSNFGDIDNDGYPDFYLGTGNPEYTSLIPNKLFKNIDGKLFADVTSAARVGNLQKGHGVSFA